MLAGRYAHGVPDLAGELRPRHRKLYDTYLQRERQKILGLLGDFDRNRFTILRSITLLRQLSLHLGLVDQHADAVRGGKLDALASSSARSSAATIARSCSASSPGSSPKSATALIEKASATATSTAARAGAIAYSSASRPATIGCS